MKARYLFIRYLFFLIFLFPWGVKTWSPDLCIRFDPPIQYNTIKNKFASSLASGHVDVLLWFNLDRLLDLVVYQLEHHLLSPQQESELLHLLLVQSRGEAGDIREGLGRWARHVRMQKKPHCRVPGSGWWGSVCTGSCERGA